MERHVCQERARHLRHKKRVSFGDRPSGTIATVALQKMAKMAQEKYPQEAKIIRDNTYMDDIIESVGDRERAESIRRNIDKLVDVGEFGQLRQPK